MTKFMPDNLLVAIASGQPVSLRAILALGIDLNAVGASVPRTVLMAAAFAGRSDLIRELVENGAVLDLVNTWGLTALHEAVAQDQADAVQTLLELGANVEAQSEFGSTPLMAAAAWGNVAAMKVLLAWGANIHHCDKAGCTALMIAEEKEEVATAALLRAATKAKFAPAQATEGS